MSLRALCVSLLLFALASPVLADLLHGQFLPPDDAGLREGALHMQQLIQITEYSLVLGSQRHSNQQPIPITSPSLLRLKGKPLSKGANVSYVLVYFDSDGKSLKKPSYDTQQRVLTLHYPVSQLPVILQVLREQTLYCQFLSYANGHVWADLHTGAIRTR